MRYMRINLHLTSFTDPPSLTSVLPMHAAPLNKSHHSKYNYLCQILPFFPQLGVEFTGGPFADDNFSNFTRNVHAEST